MSYNINTKLVLFDLIEKGYDIHLGKCEELDKLFKKYGGEVNVSISKPKDSKTDQQMRALRALIGAFFFTGASSCPEDVKDVDRFTIWLKLQFGYYIDMDVHGQKLQVIKSFGDASKDELQDVIDKVLKLIDMCEACQDEKIIEIRNEMERRSKEKQKLNSY